MTDRRPPGGRDFREGAAGEAPPHHGAMNGCHPRPSSAMPNPAAPHADAGAAWECFLRSIRESLATWPRVPPMPAREDHGNPTVRAMQRARRYTWMHARHGLNWSMFESIRISVRLAEAFAAWTRDGAPDLEVLAAVLEAAERDAREPAPLRHELAFVDELTAAAASTDLHLTQMDLAMRAFRRISAK